MSELKNNEVEIESIEDIQLEEIKNLNHKMNTEMVPKEDLIKMQEHAKKLARELATNVPVPVETAKRSAVEIAKELKNENLRKVDHVKLSLEYREAFMKEQGRDPWVGGSITEAESANIAAGYKALLSEYGEDPNEFTYRFDQALRDDPAVVQALRAKRN